MSNSIFRQVRVAAFAVLAAFAFAGSVRATDVKVYYQVTENVAEGGPELKDTHVKFYTLYSVSADAIKNVEGITASDYANETTLSTWLADKGSYWARKDAILKQAVQWSIASTLQKTVVYSKTGSAECLRGYYTFTGVASVFDALANDCAWMILYYNNGTDNGVRVMHVNTTDKATSARGKLTTSNVANLPYADKGKTQPVLKGGNKESEGIAFITSKRACSKAFKIILPDNGVTVSTVTNAAGKVYAPATTPAANAGYYGIDTAMAISIVYKAPAGYEFEDVCKDTYTYAYTVDGKGTDVPNTVVPTLQKLSSAKTKDDNGDDVTVFVSPTWLANNGMTADDLTKTGANDIVVWQSYVLGLDPNDEDSQTVLKPVQTDDASNLTLSLGALAPKTDAGVDVKFVLQTKGETGNYSPYGDVQDEHEFDFPLSGISGVKYFRIVAKFYSKQQ